MARTYQDSYVTVKVHMRAYVRHATPANRMRGFCLIPRGQYDVGAMYDVTPGERLGERSLGEPEGAAGS
jgi:hypothetical protein